MPKPQEGLTAAQWARLLSRKKWRPNKECVIATSGSGKSIRVTKEQQRRLFRGWQGADLRGGQEIEIVHGSGNFPKIEIPEWASDALLQGRKGATCIIAREGRFFLKRLRLVEEPAHVPGCMIRDEFSPQEVVRSFSLDMEPRSYAYEDFEKAVAALGQFRHNPVRALVRCRSFHGLLARRDLAGSWADTDRASAEGLRRQIVARQLKNGSWENSTIATACTVMRLLQLGAKPAARPISRACKWLLASPEPEGFPGMFLSTPALTGTYNEWRDECAGAYKQFRPPKDYRAREEFAANSDLFGRVISVGRECHKWSLWSAAVAVEALVRCGHADAERVRTALCTFLTIRFGGGTKYWCSNVGRRSNVSFAKSTGAPDFDIARDYMKSERVDWPKSRIDVVRRVADRNHAQWSLSSGKTTLMRRACGDAFDCSGIIQRAFTWHHDYTGSSLEQLFSLEQASMQGWDGAWPNNHVGAMLSLLGQSETHASALAVLRTVPSLIRHQGSDGLWDLGQFPDPRDPGRRQEECPIPPQDVVAYHILVCLKKFGFLDALLPSK